MTSPAFVAVRRALIVFVTTAAMVLGVQLPAAATGPTFTLSGTVFLGTTATRAPAGEVSVYAQRIDDYGATGPTVLVDASGNYSMSGLVAGTYRVYFGYLGTQDYANQYWGNKPNGNAATLIEVGANLAGQNITLPKRAKISGTVYLGSGGTPAASNVRVYWSRADGWGNWSSNSNDAMTVDSNGSYSITLDPGNYRLRFESLDDSFQYTQLFGASYYQGIVFGTSNLTQNATLAPYGSITGRVSLGTTASPAGAGTVRVKLTTSGISGGEPTTLTDSSGNYSFPKVGDGSYSLSFEHLAGGFKPLASLAVVIGAAGRNPINNLTLAPANTITGQVYLGDSGTTASAGEVRVTSYGPGAQQTTLTDSEGHYTLSGLVDGSFTVKFTYLGAANYSDQFWQHAISADAAQTVSVYTAGVLVNPVLPHGADVTGRVTLPGGAPASDAAVIASNENGTVEVRTDSNGVYSFDRMAPGDYAVRVWHNEFTIDGIFSRSLRWGETPSNYRDLLAVAANSELTDVDFGLVDRASATGSATCAICSLPDIDWAHAGYSLQTMVDGHWVGTMLDGYDIGNYGANFAFSNLLPATYRVMGKYAQDVGPSWGLGTSAPFTVVAGQQLTGLTLSLGRPTSDRVDGANRFDTSSDLSSRAFPDGADVVFIANGYNFPDALGAGPVAAIEGGPLLLVTPTSIPSETLVELNRLQPRKIVIVGGTPAVSEAVEYQLNQLSSLDGPAVRLSGPSRYETSLAIARYGFPGGADVAYIATGYNFPDALSAGPAAASRNAPVILVPGLSASVDQSTRSLLVELGVSKVYLVGSAAVLSTGMESSIDAIPGVSVERLGGSDRYETGVIVNQNAGFTSSHAYFAVGTNYPDALSGGAVAGIEGAPLYVVPSACLTPPLVTALYNQQPELVTLVGSTAVLAPPAQLFSKC